MQRLKNGMHEYTVLSGFTVMIHQYRLHRWRTLQQMRLCKNTIDLDFSYIGAVVEISPEWRHPSFRRIPQQRPVP